MGSSEHSSPRLLRGTAALLCALALVFGGVTPAAFAASSTPPSLPPDGGPGGSGGPGGPGGPGGMGGPGGPGGPGGIGLKSQTIKVKHRRRTFAASDLLEQGHKFVFKVKKAKTKLKASAKGKRGKAALKVRTKGKKRVVVKLRKHTEPGTYKVRVHAKKTRKYARSPVKKIKVKVI